MTTGQQQDHEEPLPAEPLPAEPLLASIELGTRLWHAIDDIQGTLRSIVGRLDRLETTVEENQRDTNRRLDRLTATVIVMGGAMTAASSAVS